MLHEITLILSIFFQLGTAIFAIRCIRLTKKRISWILIAGATILMAIRRLIPLISLLKGHPERVHLGNELLGLVLSILFFIGVISIRHIFSEWAVSSQHTRELAEERRILLKEVHHRIKNNISFLASLFSLQARKSNSPEAAQELEGAVDRIHSIGALYDKLLTSSDYQNIDTGLYFNDLIRHMSATLPDTITTTQEIEAFPLGNRVLFPLGLIVNELFTNSVKHAFPDGRKGQISLSLKKQDGMVVLKISDDGIGIPDTIIPENDEKMGSLLIRSLSQQIKGELHLEKNNGTTISVVFPE